MAKKKTKEYLPLFWCKRFEEDMKRFLPLTPEEMWEFAEDDVSMTTQKTKLFKKYPTLKKIYFSLLFDFNNSKETEMIKLQEAQEFLNDCKCNAIVRNWMNNKQAFKMDKDFLDALVNTDKLMIIKDAFDYLPYSVIYVDLSENKEICNTLSGEGLFIYPKKRRLDKIKKEVYDIYICKVDRKYFYYDTFIVVNETQNVDFDSERQDAYITCRDIEIDGTVIGEKSKSVNMQTYKKIVLQILTYLCSVQPDITESEETKVTYRKPKPAEKPKNRFSEVRKWDVGVRYGVAFNKWQKAKESGEISVSEGSGARKRPHLRKAHWHRYWYGKRDSDERELRPVWVSELLVNSHDDTNDHPVVIHNVQ